VLDAHKFDEYLYAIFKPPRAMYFFTKKIIYCRMSVVTLLYFLSFMDGESTVQSLVRMAWSVALLRSHMYDMCYIRYVSLMMNLSGWDGDARCFSARFQGFFWKRRRGGIIQIRRSAVVLLPAPVFHRPCPSIVRCRSRPRLRLLRQRSRALSPSRTERGAYGLDGTQQVTLTR
jgi:hypothetical protein